jgi:Family of unknown function (DUF5681)
MSERDSGGRFKKGVSGNPGGRPRTPASVIEATRALTTKAIETLEHMLDNGENEMTRVRAAEILLNRAWGTPAQHVNVENKTSYAEELDRIKKVRAASDSQSTVVALFPPAISDDNEV